MRVCLLCGFSIDESDLTRHYLNDPDLVSFIVKKHPGWEVEQGACSNCLETHYRELHSKKKKNKDEISEERTVVTEAIDLIDESRAAAQEASLIIIHGIELGKKYNVEDQMLIGRAENAHIRINEENVSRLHAVINKRNGEIFIEDQNSTNGTLVNTRKVKSKALRDGDLILIGNTIMKFMSGSTVEHQYHEEIYRLATLDGLTRAFNKNFFIEKLSEEFGRSKRYDRNLSVIIFDFDHFKKINDTYGHLTGDEILKQAATIIMKNLRKEDMLGRYGGEEFGVILPETHLENAMQLAEKIRKLVERSPFEYAGKTLSVTVSLGVAAIRKSVQNVNQLIDLADKALYHAKKSGRNCVKSA